MNQRPHENFGKLPPQALDVEEAVLGAILHSATSKECMLVMELFEPEFFYKDANQKIFQAIKKLYTDDQKIDVLTVKQQCQKDGNLEAVGGAYHITMLTQRIASTSHTDEHAVIVYQKYISREIILISGKAIQKAFSDEHDELLTLDEVSEAIIELASNSVNVIKKLKGNNEIGALEAFTQELINIEDDIFNEVAPGLSYGFKYLDKDASKMQGGDLIIIAGRPSMGKSLFVCCIAVYVAIVEDKPVDFYSLEMPLNRIVHRMMSMRTGIPTDKIIARDLTPAQVKIIREAQKSFNNNLRFYTLNRKVKMSVEFIRSNQRRKPSKLIIIDYLQLMEAENYKKSNNREQEVSTISRGLKTVAMEFGIPVIALAQLNRALEARAEKRPQLGDLRESGAIEQDADIVMFLYRAAYYGKSTGDLPENTTEVLIEKNRNGGKSTVAVLFNTQKLCFEDYEPNLQEDLFNNSEEEIPY